MTIHRTTYRAAGPSHWRLLPVAAAVVLAAVQAGTGMAQAQDGPAAGIIAAHIRSQGYVCTQPVTATRDSRASRPNGAVWVLRCRNARYRVQLVPDMAAEVSRIE
jgi:hypothetical protein